MGGWVRRMNWKEEEEKLIYPLKPPTHPPTHPPLVLWSESLAQALSHPPTSFGNFIYKFDYYGGRTHSEARHTGR